MNVCLRCNQSCSATSKFCDDCRSLLESQQQASNAVSEERASAPLHAIMPGSQKKQEVFAGESVPYATIPLPTSPFPQTPSPDSLGTHALLVEHILYRLNDSARRIAAVEQTRRRGPRASRLAPLRDMSAEIQRLSTPLPKATASAERARL